MSPRDYGRPICQRHAVLMSSNGTKGDVSYYQCRVAGCDQKQVKVAKQYERLALKKPVVCGRCNVPCEVDLERSRNRRGMLVLCCPKCRWDVEVIRPDIERVIRRKRSGSNRLLDR